MKYRIYIDQSVKKEDYNIVNDYWKYEKGIFCYNNILLSKSYDIKIEDLIQFVKKNSHCEITLGECTKCGLKKNYKVKTRMNFEYIVNSFSNLCNNCNEYKVLINENYELTKTNHYNSEYAFENKIWKELLPVELEVFKGIIKYKKKYLIYRHIFKNDIYNRAIWNIINHLEYLGLVSIIRDEKSKILSFNVDSEIEKEIIDFTSN